MDTKNQHYYISIDIFKSLGIVYLIFLHHLVWMYIEGDYGRIIYPQSENFLKYVGYFSGVHPLGFQIPLLAGVTLYLSYQRKKLSWLKIITRSLLLIGLGFGMNFLAWGVEDAFTWDVLPFIGLSILISYPLIRYLKKEALVAVLSLLLAVCLGLSSAFPISRWEDHYLYSVFIGDPYGGSYWPMAPWYALFSAGVLVGFILENKPKAFDFLQVVGIICLLISFLTGKYLPQQAFDNVWGPALFKPSLFFILGIVGFSLTALSLTEKFLDKNPGLKERIAQWEFLCLGKAILWVYIFSTVFGYAMTMQLVYFYNITYTASLYVYPVLCVINSLASFFVAYFVVRKRIKIMKRKT